MTQATFINLKALSITREVKFAKRARAAADSARSALQASKTTGESVKTATAPGNSPTRLPGDCPAPQRLVSDHFEGQINLTLVDEGRKFFWPAELLRCPRCAMKPAMEADWDPDGKKPRYRVHCSGAGMRGALGASAKFCDQAIGAWHASNRDAIRCWNLAVRLAQ